MDNEYGCLGIGILIIILLVILSLLGDLLVSIINIFTGNLFFVIIASLISIAWLVFLSFKDKSKRKLSLEIFLLYVLPGMILYFTLYEVNKTSGMSNLSNNGNSTITIFSILVYYLFPIFCIASTIISFILKKRRAKAAKDELLRIEKEEQDRLLKEQALKEKNLAELKLNNFLDTINKELLFLDLSKTFYYTCEVKNNENIEFDLFNENREIEKISISRLWMTNSNIYNYLTENNNLLTKLNNLNEKLENYKIQLSNNDLCRSNYFNYFYETLKATMISLKILTDNFHNDYKISRLGVEGETLVNNALSLHTNIINLEGFQLKYEEISVECDNILITPRGVFVLEVKNYASEGQYEIYIDETGKWQKKFRTSEKNMTSPVEQNDRHVAVVNAILNHELNRTLDNTIESISIVVIANNNLNIINRSSYKSIIRPGEIYNFIQKYPVIYSEKDIFELKVAIEKHKIATKKYPVYGYKKVEKHLDSVEKFYDDISNNLIEIQRTF